MKQCKACPWKKSTRPEKDIPGGYCETKHAALKSTIATPGELRLGSVPMMACHETAVGQERACVGWTLHQLGIGNNLALRMRAFADPKFRAQIAAMRLDGPQHERLEDTLPKKKRRRKGADAEEET